MTPTTLVFDTGTIEIFPDSTRTTLPDGSTVLAMPEDTTDYYTTAVLNGYAADTTTLCIEHEVAHLALAHLLGVPSPTMALVGSGTFCEQWLCEAEEAAVLALQRYTRALKLNLVTQLAPRHKPAA